MLTSFSLANIKSYYKRCTIDFAKPIGDQNGLTVLVGKNNAGKSSILNTIASCFDHRPNVVFDKMDRHDEADPFIEIKFDVLGVPQTLTLEKVAPAWFKKKLTLEWGQGDAPYSSLLNLETPFIAYVPSRRPWEDTFQGGGEGYDMKSFEHAREATYDQARQGNRQLERLGDQLNGIILRGEKESFDILLKSILPDLADWTTDRVAGQDRIMYVSASGAYHAIRDVGDRVASIFRLCFALHRYPDSVPIILDEPELSLHPDGQKRLYEVIRKYAKTRQIIIATHSPHCIHWPDLISGTRVYRIAQDDVGHSFAFAVSQPTLRDVYAVAHKDFKNRKLFDYLGKEVFFSSGALFVEGQEDVHIISRYLEETDKAALPLFAYGAGGAPHIIKWVKLARELGLVVAALYDKDQSREALEADRAFRSDNKVLVITSPYDDIRDKFSKDRALLKEGFFSEDWEIKPDKESEFIKILEQLQGHLESDERKLSNFTMAGAAGVISIKDWKK